MSKSIDGWSALRGAARSALLAACGLGFGMTLAIAQQVQEVPKTPQQPAKRAGEETAWIKVCTIDEKTGNKQICLVKYEGLDPKTGAILIAAAVRTVGGDDSQHLVVNLPTSYSLVCRPA
jgi:invasion protein IalB